MLLVTNQYDGQSRRVRKITPQATTTYFYDGWNLVEERIAYTDGSCSTIKYYWGKDLSGTLQGAGGIGGLLVVAKSGRFYTPTYDANGNITECVDVGGNVVAQYKYSAFGEIISQSGESFTHRFSTKPYFQ